MPFAEDSLSYLGKSHQLLMTDCCHVHSQTIHNGWKLSVTTWKSRRFVQFTVHKRSKQCECKNLNKKLIWGPGLVQRESIPIPFHRYNRSNHLPLPGFCGLNDIRKRWQWAKRQNPCKAPNCPNRPSKGLNDPNQAIYIVPSPSKRLGWFKPRLTVYT